MYNWPGSTSLLHNQTAWTLPRCITGQDQLARYTIRQAPILIYNCPAHCATGLNCMMMITMHNYRYQKLVTLAQISASASYPVTQRVVRLRTGHLIMHPDRGWASVWNIIYISMSHLILSKDGVSTESSLSFTHIIS